MLKKIFKKEKGFTLVETLVAIFILLLATTAPMAVAQNGLRAAYLAKDQITAFYLAQDVMEFIKNSKDQAGLDIIFNEGVSVDWIDSLQDCIPNTGISDGCTIDTLGNDIRTCPVNTGCIGSEVEYDIPLKYDSTNLSYGFIGDDTSFSRMIVIEPDQNDGGNREIRVEVVVRWKSNESVGSREIRVVEYMTNWIGELGDQSL